MMFLKESLMNRITRSLMFSSRSDEWETPRPIFDQLHRHLGFTVDAAASPENALLPKHYTKYDSCLEYSWRNDRVWLNPPYSKKAKPVRFVRKMAEEALAGTALLPARTDTALWHDWVYPYAIALFFFRGRLKFTNPLVEGESSPAPFPSALAFYNYSLTDINIACAGLVGHVVPLKLIY